MRVQGLGLKLFAGSIFTISCGCLGMAAASADPGGSTDQSPSTADTADGAGQSVAGNGADASALPGQSRPSDTSSRANASRNNSTQLKHSGSSEIPAGRSPSTRPARVPATQSDTEPNNGSRPGAQRPRNFVRPADLSSHRGALSQQTATVDISTTNARGSRTEPDSGPSQPAGSPIGQADKFQPDGVQPAGSPLLDSVGRRAGQTVAGQLPNDWALTDTPGLQRVVAELVNGPADLISAATSSLGLTTTGPRNGLSDIGRLVNPAMSSSDIASVHPINLPTYDPCRDC